jgi:4,5-dihydroxyphthalate decarboxylase
MGKLNLTLGCAQYDLTLPLQDGRVQPQGIDLNVLFLAYEDMFWRMLRNLEFDVAETSLSAYLMSLTQGPELVAIPVFPTRVFRHSSIFVNRNRGVSQPKDLKGKRVGVPEYHMTANVWVRGILQDDYGVAPREVEWVTGGLENAAAMPKIPLLHVSKDVSIVQKPAHETLNDMLVRGEIDAVITPVVPSSFRQGSPDIARLFPDFKAVELAYYRKTKIFPPMHVIVIKHEIYEANRWIALSLYDAFDRAKGECTLDRMWDGHLRYALPFLHAAVEESRAIFKETDPFVYGVKENRNTLDTLIRYSYEQGLIPERYAIERIFAPEIINRSPN